MSTAIAIPEINLFTQSKNVNSEVVNEFKTKVSKISKAVTKMKKHLTSVDSDISVVFELRAYIHRLNLDTFSYLCETYNMQFTPFTNNSDVYFVAKHQISGIGEVCIFSEHTSINLLPNDIQQTIQVR